MKIRPMHPGDIKEIVAYEEEYFDSSLGEEYLRNGLEIPYQNYFVMEEDTKLVGYISTDINEYGEILNFFITFDKRGKGYGYKLLEYALDNFKNKGTKSVSLEVKATNENAIRLYEFFGFKKNHIRKGYYNGIDAIVMIKEMEL